MGVLNNVDFDCLTIKYLYVIGLLLKEKTC
jgi:hypothetical protein